MVQRFPWLEGEPARAVSSGARGNAIHHNGPGLGVLLKGSQHTAGPALKGWRSPLRADYHRSCVQCFLNKSTPAMLAAAAFTDYRYIYTITIFPLFSSPPSTSQFSIPQSILFHFFFHICVDFLCIQGLESEERQESG